MTLCTQGSVDALLPALSIEFLQLGMSFFNSTSVCATEISLAKKILHLLLAVCESSEHFCSFYGVTFQDETSCVCEMAVVVENSLKASSRARRCCCSTRPARATTERAQIFLESSLVLRDALPGCIQVFRFNLHLAQVKTKILDTDDTTPDLFHVRSARKQSYNLESREWRSPSMTATIGTKDLYHQWRICRQFRLHLNEVRFEVNCGHFAHQDLIVLRMVSGLDSRARLMLLAFLVQMMGSQRQEHSSECQDCYTN
ncbi:hypothetical protein KCU90_g42, partial [Aureobasidium melanogenum]